METSVVGLPGYRIYDYLLMLNPHDELRNRISDLRKEFNEKFSITKGIGGKASLALATFTNYEMMEERIIHRLNTIAQGYPPFKVELKDFGSFPSHTIFVNVVSKIPIQKLVKEIRSEAQRLMKFDDENKPYFILEPNIKIGQKLKPWQYEKAWLEYSTKHFTGRFIADSMMLLKKEKTAEHWQIVQGFKFLNMPVNIKQGQLFG